MPKPTTTEPTEPKSDKTIFLLVIIHPYVQNNWTLHDSKESF
jgi:hypothetical protein